MKDADKLVATFEELKDYLKNNLPQEKNGDYMCVGQTASTPGDPWFMTRAFFRSKELDYTVFKDYLSAYLEHEPLCESDFLNLIGINAVTLKHALWNFQEILPLYKRVIRIECED
jgi:hypothetical protein